MKKLFVLIIMVAVVVMGIGFVKSNNNGFKQEIGDYVVKLDMSDGVKFDVHEHGVMDSLEEAGSDIAEVGRDTIESICEGISLVLGE